METRDRFLVSRVDVVESGRTSAGAKIDLERLGGQTVRRETLIGIISYVFLSVFYIKVLVGVAANLGRRKDRLPSTLATASS